MGSATAAAVHLVVTTELLPSLRKVVMELGGDDAGTLVHTRPTPAGSAYPSSSAAVIVHHLCGVLSSWGAACLGGEEVERDRDAEFDYTGPVLPELDRLEALADRIPAWSAAAKARGDLAHPTGTAYPVTAARVTGTLTPERVLAHVLHDVAGHLGHVEVTRDVLLTERAER